MRFIFALCLSLAVGLVGHAQSDELAGTLQLVSRTQANPPLLVFQYTAGKSRGRIEVQDEDGLVYLAWEHARLFFAVGRRLTSGEEKESSDVLLRGNVPGWAAVRDSYTESLARLMSIYLDAREQAGRNGNAELKNYFEGRHLEILGLLKLVATSEVVNEKTRWTARPEVSYQQLDEVGRWLRLYAGSHPQAVETSEVSRDNVLTRESTFLFRQEPERLPGAQPDPVVFVSTVQQRLASVRSLFFNLPLRFEEAQRGQVTTMIPGDVKTAQTGHDAAPRAR